MNGQEMSMPEAATVYKRCTPAGFTKVIGMEMCVDVTLPKTNEDGLPMVPFTGPMNAQVRKSSRRWLLSYWSRESDTSNKVHGCLAFKRRKHQFYQMNSKTLISYRESVVIYEQCFLLYYAMIPNGMVTGVH